MATLEETPTKRPDGDEQLVSAEKPATKKRREMSTSELAASNAEREFESARKALKSSKLSIKKHYTEHPEILSIVEAFAAPQASALVARRPSAPTAPAEEKHTK